MLLFKYVDFISHYVINRLTGLFVNNLKPDCSESG